MWDITSIDFIELSFKKMNHSLILDKKISFIFYLNKNCFVEL